MLKIVIRCLVFIFCMWLIISGKAVPDQAHLGMMLAGLAGLLVLLWEYNRKYSK